VTIRVQFQKLMRAAAVDLLTEFKADSGLPLQIYRARPLSVNPPTVFVDRIREHLDYFGPTSRQRNVEADLVFLWGLFDSGDAADQRDATIDPFTDWVTDRYHAAGANTLIAVTDILDDPNFVPDWLKSAEPMYATTVTLGGFAGDA